jgi:DNA polymerase elongation subunit (family B)
LKPKILIFDIETAPKIAYVWRFFKENISAKQVKEHGHILSFAAKWLGEDEIFYEENRKDNDKKIVSLMCDLLNQADMVVTHNGEQFDMKQVRARAVIHGIAPPSPVKIIDTLKIAKNEFSFPSNSLEYLTEVMGCKIKKDKHDKFPGFELWLECLKGNKEAWDEMKHYNIRDILSLEELYLKFRPYDTKHPNVVVFSDPSDKVCCPKCGSDQIHFRGYAYTNFGKYRKFQCTSCGGWGRSRYTIRGKDENLLGNLVT